MGLTWMSHKTHRVIGSWVWRRVVRKFLGFVLIIGSWNIGIQCRFFPIFIGSWYIGIHKSHMASVRLNLIVDSGMWVVGKVLVTPSLFIARRRRCHWHHRRFVLEDEDAVRILVVPLRDIQILVALRSPRSSIWSFSGSRMHDEGLGLEIYSLTAISAVIWWITSRNWWCSGCCSPILIRANYSFKDQECDHLYQ